MGNYVGIPTMLPNFIQIGYKGFRAPHCLLGYFLWWAGLNAAHSQDATTDIDGKYVKRRGSVPFEVAKPTFNIHIPFPPKTDMDSRRIFKLGGDVDHVTRHV